jgi:hypothetical protein
MVRKTHWLCEISLTFHAQAPRFRFGREILKFWQWELMNDASREVWTEEYGWGDWESLNVRDKVLVF